MLPLAIRSAGDPAVAWVAARLLTPRLRRDPSPGVARRHRRRPARAARPAARPEPARSTPSQRAAGIVNGLRNGTRHRASPSGREVRRTGERSVCRRRTHGLQPVAPRAHRGLLSDFDQPDPRGVAYRIGRCRAVVRGWMAARAATGHAGVPRRPRHGWRISTSFVANCGLTLSSDSGSLSFHGSPIVVGFFRSTILLPAMAASWSDDRRRAVLLHELAHVKRGDCRVQALAQTRVRFTGSTRSRGTHTARCAWNGSVPATTKFFEQGRWRPRMPRICSRSRATCGRRSVHEPALAMARPSELEGRVLAVLATERARVPVATSRWLVAASLVATTAVASERDTAGHGVDEPAPSGGYELPTARYLWSTEPTISERLKPFAPKRRRRRRLPNRPIPTHASARSWHWRRRRPTRRFPPSRVRSTTTSADVREKAALALGLLSSTGGHPASSEGAARS